MAQTRGLTRIALVAICLGAGTILAACGAAGSSDSGAATGAAAGSAVYSPPSSGSASSSASHSSSSSSSSVSQNDPPAGPGGVTLDWTPPIQNTDGTPVAAGEVTGYRILYGESPSALDQFVAIPDPATTTYTFQNLPTSTWYFAIVAVDSAGNESAPTNVISAAT